MKNKFKTVSANMYIEEEVCHIHDLSLVLFVSGCTKTRKMFLWDWFAGILNFLGKYNRGFVHNYTK